MNEKLRETAERIQWNIVCLKSLNYDHGVEAERVLSIGIPLSWFIIEGIVDNLNAAGTEALNETDETLIWWIKSLNEFPSMTIREWWKISDNYVKSSDI